MHLMRTSIAKSATTGHEDFARDRYLAALFQVVSIGIAGNAGHRTEKPEASRWSDRPRQNHQRAQAEMLTFRAPDTELAVGYRKLELEPGV